MPSINMIAERRAAKKALEMTSRRLFYLVGGEMLIVLGLASCMMIQTFVLKGTLADLEGQMVSLQPTIQRIEQIEVAQMEIAPKLRLLKQAQENLLDWHTTLQELSFRLPAETFLTAVDVVKPAANKGEIPLDMNFTGLSSNQQLVGDTMLRLLEYPRFERIDLKFTQAREIEERSAVEFQFTARLKLLHPEKSESEKEEGSHDKS